MLFHLFEYLDRTTELPGAGLFSFLSFRAALAVLTSLVISIVFGGRIVSLLRRQQVGETVRDLGLEGQMSKQGTPTMGGIMILGAILIPVLLVADLTNVYIQLMVLVTVWMGAIGFLDDYIKVFRKNKEGLAGRFKILGQVGLGLIVGSVILFHPEVQVREHDTWYHYAMEDGVPVGNPVLVTRADSVLESGVVLESGLWRTHDTRRTKTTFPFLKNNDFNYQFLVSFLPAQVQGWAFPVVFIGIMILIIAAVSNGANITDGLDGLATGTSAIIVFTLLLFAYVSGNTVLAEYLGIMYIPDSGELVVFSAAFVGACIGFLWWNAFPAQVFMGDTGSLAIGGIIATLAIAVRKELLIPVLCGIFLIENLSVVMQVSWFRYTRKKYGEGRRIFRMAPLHHHYQKLGFPETKIVTRFWIIGILLAVVSIVTLKVR
ncbi:MAG: phospho-N-acetylmuramoyl-pentapeptide-transferase [Bacteroidetes bacterium]|nr:phospho-N-acetylmuramoyl-pentapeptide-transferase [Bacteroidota bacterium]